MCSSDLLDQDKDVMIVSGSSSMFSGKYCNVDGISVVRALGIKSIVIDRYVKELNYDYLMAMKEALGEQLVGVLLNDIPPARRPCRARAGCTRVVVG